MNHPNRDSIKLISYCCKQMEHELSRGDIVDYKWYTRDSIIKSYTTSQVYTSVDFCPWCGKYIGSYSLHDEYLESYEKAKKEDPTLPDIMYYSKLEDFQEKFLMNWESQNQTMQYNQERLKKFLENAKDDGFVVPRTPTLNVFQTEKITNAIIDKAGLESTEQALTLLAIIFQKGGTARHCDGNLEAEVQGKR